MKIVSLTFVVGALVAPLAASAAPVSTSSTVAIVTQVPAERRPVGPSVAELLTPQQLELAWQDFIAAQFNVDHSS